MKQIIFQTAARTEVLKGSVKTKIKLEKVQVEVLVLL